MGGAEESASTGSVLADTAEDAKVPAADNAAAPELMFSGAAPAVSQAAAVASAPTAQTAPSLPADVEKPSELAPRLTTAIDPKERELARTRARGLRSGPDQAEAAIPVPRYRMSRKPGPFTPS